MSFDLKAPRHEASAARPSGAHSQHV